MSGAAEIRVAGRGEMFIADVCRIEGPWLHAEGRWRTKVGGNHTAIGWSEPKSYTWPVSTLVEIRWQPEATP